ncbi:MAG: hypothetical protein ACFCUL_06885 [Flavobacteriaceae bacterium]
MMRFFKNSVNYVSVKIALVSFIIGHLFFLCYLFLPEHIIIAFGLAFMILFLGSHATLLPILFFNLLVNLKNYEEHMVALIMVFLNILLALFYFSIL